MFRFVTNFVLLALITSTLTEGSDETRKLRQALTKCEGLIRELQLEVQQLRSVVQDLDRRLTTRAGEDARREMIRAKPTLPMKGDFFRSRVMRELERRRWTTEDLKKIFCAINSDPKSLADLEAVLRGEVRDGEVIIDLARQLRSIFRAHPPIDMNESNPKYPRLYEGN